MTRATRKTSFQLPTLRTEGNLLPDDLLQRVAAQDTTLPGLSSEAYHLLPGETLRDAISRAWLRMQGVWTSFQRALARLPPDDRATSITRDRWLLPLLQELGFGRLVAAPPVEVAGRSFPISHAYQHSPIHLLGWRVDLDRRTERVAGAAQSSPHGLVQDLLNRSEAHLWAVLSNGRTLRLLRDNHSLVRQAYIEFDLEMMMTGEHFADFALLWLVCHQSRIEAERPHDCWLEKWFGIVRDEGQRALERLQVSVKRAIVAFGNGFLKHRANTALRTALSRGTLDVQAYYHELLRLVYRLIFLFVAEDRGVLFDPDAPESVRERYNTYYATARLRRLATRRRGGPHADLWQGLRLVLGKLYAGCRELGLPALGSFLWKPTTTPHLDAAELSNEDLLAALHALIHVENDQGFTYTVNWKSLGSDELGGVYEALLGLWLRKPGDYVELAQVHGSERKATGTYYTKDSLVQCLLDYTLDPAIDAAIAGKHREPALKALLNLKVCDPACGSGHFLVAAARRLARRVAALREGDEEPSPPALREAMRDVIKDCIFGVDLSPMAVELCKVSLWMEAFVPGKTLPFLESHIVRGNALLGATPVQVLQPDIPEDAFEALQCDDDEVAKRLSRRNRDEIRNRGAQESLILGEQSAPRATAAPDVRGRALDIERSGDEDLKGLEAKEHAYDAHVHGVDYAAELLRAHAFCAAYLWPRQKQHEADAITSLNWWRLKRDPSLAPPGTRAMIEKLADEYQLFHWHLAFPAVFQPCKSLEDTRLADNPHAGWDGGFDVVLGNPPWDTLSPDAKEFFSVHDQQIRFVDPDGQKKIIRALLQDKFIAEQWERNCRELYSTAHFLKNSGRYRLYAPGNLGKGDFNVYRMFVETALDLTRTGGRAGQITPEGLYNGANCMAIRKALFEDFRLECILGFENQREIWFPGIDSRTKFAIYSALKEGNTTIFRAAFNIRSEEHLKQIQQGGGLQLPASTIREFSSDALAIMEFGNQRDIDIAMRMYSRHPRLGAKKAGPPLRSYMAEVHMGNNRDLFTEDPDGYPLYEGRMVAHYDYRAKGYKSGRGRKAEWEDFDFTDPGKRIRPQWYVKNPPEKTENRISRYRIGFCDVASPTNARSLVAALIPPGTIAGDKVPTITFQDAYAYIPWLAVANSFTMDFLARKKISLKMSYTVLDSLPFPRLRVDSPLVAALAPRVLRLTCTGPEMNGYWNAMAAHGWVEAVKKNAPPPGVIDPLQRLQLIAEIEAIVARSIFDLSEDELAYILDTFPIIEKQDRKQYGDYRTKQLVLEAYRRLPKIDDPTAAPPVHDDEVEVEEPDEVEEKSEADIEATPEQEEAASPRTKRTRKQADASDAAPKTQAKTTSKRSSPPKQDNPTEMSTPEPTDFQLQPPGTKEPRKQTAAKNVEPPPPATRPSGKPVQPQAADADFQLKPPSVPQLGLFKKPSARTPAKDAPKDSFQLASPPGNPQLRLDRPISKPSDAAHAPAHTPKAGSSAKAPASPTPDAADDPPRIQALRAAGGKLARPEILAVLRLLHRATAPLSKEEILRATGLDEKAWPPLIKLLVEVGLVEPQGKAKGTRYTIT